MKFRHAILAADIVVFAIKDEMLHIGLVEVEKGYFKSYPAVPGGLVRLSETLDECARRILTDAVQTESAYLEQLFTFGDINRDPHGRIVSVTYFALLAIIRENRGSMMSWHPVNQIPKLAYDHNKIVDFAVMRLRNKITYSNVIFGLLPDQFTFSQLQQAYEIVLDKKLDKRNFRKKFLALDLLQQTGNKIEGRAHRPANLFTFKQKCLTTIPIFNP